MPVFQNAVHTPIVVVKHLISFSSARSAAKTDFYACLVEFALALAHADSPFRTNKRHRGRSKYSTDTHTPHTHVLLVTMWRETTMHLWKTHWATMAATPAPTSCIHSPSMVCGGRSTLQVSNLEMNLQHGLPYIQSHKILAGEERDVENLWPDQPTSSRQKTSRCKKLRYVDCMLPLVWQVDKCRCFVFGLFGNS